MKRVLSLWMLCALPSLASAQVDELQRALDSARVALDIPGASVAVILPDGTLWSGGSGVANGGGTPVSSDMLFEIGSITKTFTSALVLSLAAEGRLGLDDPLARWLPDFPNAEGVTIRHLLQHTSGLHDYTDNPEYIPALRADFARVWTPEDSYAYMQAPYFAPGDGWHYSNANYLLLGQIAEEAGGESYDVLLRSRLLEPQGLARTFYAPREEASGPRAHAFLDINGDGRAEDLTSLVATTSFITAAGAAGAIVSTAEDLARWLRKLHEGAVVGGEWFDAMTRWVERGDGMQYGLGVLRYTPGDVELLGHKGNTVGFSASAWHAPELDVTVAVLTNAHLVDVTPMALALIEVARKSSETRP